jgi:hypothetical protein
MAVTAKKYTSPIVGRTDEAYSPPYSIPRGNTTPTPTEVMRVDEPYSPPYKLPRTVKIAPTYVGRVTQPYTPPSELSRYINRTTYRKTRGRRLV